MGSNPGTRIPRYPRRCIPTTSRAQKDVIMYDDKNFKLTCGSRSRSRVLASLCTSQINLAKTPSPSPHRPRHPSSILLELAIPGRVQTGIHHGECIPTPGNPDSPLPSSQLFDIVFLLTDASFGFGVVSFVKWGWDWGGEEEAGGLNNRVCRWATCPHVGYSICISCLERVDADTSGQES